MSIPSLREPQAQIRLLSKVGAVGFEFSLRVIETDMSCKLGLSYTHYNYDLLLIFG